VCRALPLTCSLSSAPFTHDSAPPRWLSRTKRPETLLFYSSARLFSGSIPPQFPCTIFYPFWKDCAVPCLICAYRRLSPFLAWPLTPPSVRCVAVVTLIRRSVFAANFVHPGKIALSLFRNPLPMMLFSGCFVSSPPFSYPRNEWSFDFPCDSW